MPNENGLKPVASEAEVRTKKGFSIVWVVPLLALAIGGWLTYKALSEKGPEIIITFATADGLVAGKTKVKYKDVEVGQVTDIRLGKTVNNVEVLVEMEPETKPYLTDKTRFWVVRAKIAAGEVTGLGTLLSGAYLAIDPSKEGKSTKNYVGLEKAPILTSNLKGRQFTLTAHDLGSIDVGTPIYYRHMKVGKVIDYHYDEALDEVLLAVFIDAPFDQKVRENTRFWNASGLDMTLDASGVKVDSQSLVTIMLGGISFGVPNNIDPGDEVEEKAIFSLAANRESAQELEYKEKSYYLMYFNQSVRGLEPGAPVDFQGIQIGEVVDVNLILDLDQLDFEIPVLVMLEPGRIKIKSDGKILPQDQIKEVYQKDPVGDKKALTEVLVERGLRARLKTGNLLTGALYVSLVVVPDAEPAQIVYGDKYPTFPTQSSSLEQMTESVSRILKKVEQLPLEEIGDNLNSTLEELQATVAEAKLLVANVNADTVPELGKTLQQFDDTLKDIKATLGSGSALNYNARNALDELTMAVRSIRTLTEYLERNPEALIFGKKGEKK
jgi:paraquat-inducible protein B